MPSAAGDLGEMALSAGGTKAGHTFGNNPRDSFHSTSTRDVFRQLTQADIQVFHSLGLSGDLVRIDRSDPLIITPYNPTNHAVLHLPRAFPPLLHRQHCSSPPARAHTTEAARPVSASDFPKHVDYPFGPFALVPLGISDHGPIPRDGHG